MMKNIFAVYEPKTDDGPAILEIFTTAQPARELFDSTIKDGTANREVGQYLYSINVEESEQEAFIEGFDEAFKRKFEDLDVEELDSFASNDADAWGDDALGALDDEFDDSDEDYAITH